MNGQGFCCDDSKTLKSFAASANDNPELFQYYYHSDHLGSSSLITNLDGEVVQHIEYVPFGEVFIEERNNTWNTPYLFNAKELDEETGLYYYGARYYDPRTSIWLSVDALATYNPFEEENFINGQHNGGIYNSFNHGVYSYCYQNPVKYVDPNGKQGIPGVVIGLVTEYGSIIGEKMLFEDMSFIEANKDLSWYDAGKIAIAGGMGAVSGVAKFTKWIANPKSQKIIGKLLEVGLNVLEEAIKTYIDPDTDFDLTSVLAGVLADVGMGHLLPSTKVFKEVADNAQSKINRATDLMTRSSATESVINKQSKVVKEATLDKNLNQTLDFMQDVGRGTVQKMTGNKVSDIVQEKTQK
ncbi:RHS repeat-associated protein [Dysgonomonas sp. PFB1-18]|uniref:RHS repeat domain-containing protein n=1 Tax=unclassified Dysgonomonas TaxID=2630389 RepID=UPI002475DB33|nr:MULTISPECIES: RHS repeat-associated core domain-containing protein [unclassified Dysgonomonas]MDH6310602.1 RHS repeat-associated protein [Dysgonomonas sp. PF1-14]MDH6340453.1 RHS repeat-associated protein [Dysgonomonas sp. PF1-16]MDH6382139.1 RHS repeat-associated protein [Dysgonomonas sp. PFB1-18]MDH6399483.1 RHS repeat-associated protein [Dysgonomonas sp. PF1-23]